MVRRSRTSYVRASLHVMATRSHPIMPPARVLAPNAVYLIGTFGPRPYVRSLPRHLAYLPDPQTPFANSTSDGPLYHHRSQSMHHGLCSSLPHWPLTRFIYVWTFAWVCRPPYQGWSRQSAAPELKYVLHLGVPSGWSTLVRRTVTTAPYRRCVIVTPPTALSHA